MNWLSLALTVLSGLPNLIAKVEGAHPTTPGAGKKTMVMDQIATAFQAADPIYGPLIAGHPTVVAAMSVATDALVDAFNQTATVATEQAAAAPPPPPPPPVPSGVGPSKIGG